MKHTNTECIEVYNLNLHQLHEQICRVYAVGGISPAICASCMPMIAEVSEDEIQNRE